MVQRLRVWQCSRSHRTWIQLTIATLLCWHSVKGFLRVEVTRSCRRQLVDSVGRLEPPLPSYGTLIIRKRASRRRNSSLISHALQDHGMDERLVWYSSPLIQWTTMLGVYWFHLIVLSQQMVGCSAVGYDALVGAIVLTGLLLQTRHSRPPKPWKLPSPNNKLFRLSTVFALIALVFAYLQTGKFSLLWEDWILELSNAGWPITVWSSRALQVVCSHLTWTGAVVSILAIVPFPAVFRPRRIVSTSRITNTDHANSTLEIESNSAASLDQTYWFTWKSRNWLHWASAGFLASNFVFALADALNHQFLPSVVISQPNPSIVSQLVVGPRGMSWLGCVAPCISAPFLEELLYRGFVWPAMATLLGGNGLVANVIQSLVFSAHHVSTTGAIPLAALGFFWAWLYQASGSLATVIAVHVLWNARVFLSAWFLGF